mmetsp:Transcript_61250/g.145829  ORF Transcript_61250/g.145829 Transcript_61250/m.145829 type:complete len:219 (-) Transcript_61250:74-730(-)
MTTQNASGSAGTARGWSAASGAAWHTRCIPTPAMTSLPAPVNLGRWSETAPPGGIAKESENLMVMAVLVPVMSGAKATDPERNACAASTRSTLLRCITACPSRDATETITPPPPSTPAAGRLMPADTGTFQLTRPPAARVPLLTTSVIFCSAASNDTPPRSDPPETVTPRSEDELPPWNPGSQKDSESPAASVPRTFAANVMEMLRPTSRGTNDSDDS